MMVPSAFVDTKKCVQADARTEMCCIFILTVQEVLLIVILVHFYLIKVRYSDTHLGCSRVPSTRPRGM